MKLLILTQKVDREDSVLGFFHNWILKLSQEFEKTTVICLEKGKVDLPKNVRIFSLGKENGESKLKYVSNFYKYVWCERKNYDAVLVHMNQEYVLLGCIFWKIWGKKVYMWRNHSYGNFMTRIAVALSEKVFCTSPSSYTARFKKTVIMPVGIDTEVFKSETRNTKSETRNKILFLSRIAPIKKPDILIETLKILKEKNIDFVCNFYGDSLPKDNTYFEMIKNKVKEYGLDTIVIFNEAVANYETPKIYYDHKIFINLTPSGSMDKTILEAVLCGCIPIVLNDYFRDIFESEMLTSENAYNLSAKIEYWLQARGEDVIKSQDKLQKYVLENHSLNALIEKLCIIIKK